MQIVIAHQWDGAPAREDEHVHLKLSAEAGRLTLAVDAPFHGDPAPGAPPGPTPGLWNYEVVELFLFAADGHYLELELGPHGHYLLLKLHGVRNVIHDTARLAAHEVHGVDRGRWRGFAHIDAAMIPRGIAHYNAHAIHGQEGARRYLSAVPAGGARPDFHRPEVHAALDPALLRALAQSRSLRADEI